MNASNDGTGAVLLQEWDGQERVVAYASRCLSKAEHKYCVVIIQQFRSYLLGKPFKLRTDHGSLSWLQNFKDPSGQLARWLEQLKEFDFEIVHRRGTNHRNADALSRRPCHQCHWRDSTCSGNQDKSECFNTSNNCRTNIVIALEDIDNNTCIRQAQLEDSTIGPILKARESGTRPGIEFSTGQNQQFG